jgi:hypothetical protein
MEDQYYKYFAVYRINFCTTAGQSLARIKEITDTREYLKGFNTKRQMQEWAQENAGAFQTINLLKPIV